MKRICLIIVIIIYTFSNVYGQIRFSKFYDYNRTSNLIVDVIPIADSGYFMVSQCTDYKSFDTLNYQKTYLNFINTNEYGDSVFSKVYNRPRFSLKGLKLLEANWGYLLAGEEYDLKKYKEIGLGSYIKIWKISTTGDTLSTISYDLQFGDDQVVKIIKTYDNGFAILGQTCNQIQSGKNCNYFLMKLDSNGNKLWQKIYKQSSNSFENPNSIIQLPDGSFYLFGQSTLNNIMKWFLVKTDSTGNHLWQKTYFEFPRQAGLSLKYFNNKIILAGSYATNADGTGISRGCVMLIDTSGVKIWNKSFGGIKNSGFFDVSIYNNSSIILVGANGSLDSLYRDQGWLLAINIQGDSIYQRIYNANPIWPELIYSIRNVKDGFLMSGYGVNPIDTVSTQDAWLLKVDSFGCLTPGCQFVGIENTTFNREEIKIYPNPANDKIQLKHSNKITSYRIADYTGKLIDAGNYSDYGINVNNFLPGNYIIQVLLENKSQAFGKLIID